MTSRRTLFSIGAAAAIGAAVLPAHARAQGAAAGPNRSGYVKTKDGVDLFVKDWGQGRPIILTHAWPLSSDCWE